MLLHVVHGFTLHFGICFLTGLYFDWERLTELWSSFNFWAQIMSHLNHSLRNPCRCMYHSPCKWAYLVKMILTIAWDENKQKYMIHRIHRFCFLIITWDYIGKKLQKILWLLKQCNNDIRFKNENYKIHANT